MKYIALVKADDKIMSGEWHSGSTVSYGSKIGLDTKQEAEDAAMGIVQERFHNDTDRYRFTVCTLAYDETDSQNVTNFFKYMY